MKKIFRKKNYLMWIFVPCLSALMTTLDSCDKFEGSQEIPAYIRIDSVAFTTDYSSEGTDNHKFVDVWVYVDDQLIGGFELPAEFPVLDEGICKVEIRAGIKMNGISDTRVPYPCVDACILQNVRLSPDSVTVIRPSFHYMENSEFVWREDFEDENLAINEGNGSDTSIYRTEPENNPAALLDENSEYSGIVFLDAVRNDMLLESNDGNNEGFVLSRGDFVFLEMNFKTTTPVLVGLYIRSESVGGIEDRPFIVINKSDLWNKIYINFTPIVNEYSDAVDFKIYLSASKPVGENDQQIMFDNIKLVTRPNL